MQLWGTAPWLAKLDSIATAISVPTPAAALCEVSGQGSVTGLRDAMAASAGCPACFCEVVAYLHRSWLASKFREELPVQMFVESLRLPELRHAWFLQELLALLV